MKREEIVQAERELDAVLELIQESEEISGRDDIKEERMKERNRIQEAEAEESLTRINMEDTADMLQYEACRELKRCRDVHILRPGDSLPKASPDRINYILHKSHYVLLSTVNAAVY